MKTCIKAEDRVREIRAGLKSDLESREALPGVEASKIMHVMMQDVVSDYDVPEDVPEWAWVEAHASYAHVRNGKDGI